MRLSVIVATRNRVHTIVGCLASIAAAFANAAPLDAEIVVVDNGSRDATTAVVQQWASGSPYPVRLLQDHFELLQPYRNGSWRQSIRRG